MAADFYSMPAMKAAKFDGATIPATAKPLRSLGGSACRGEWEHYAFVIDAKVPLADVAVKWGNFSGPSPMPASVLDARICKVWWVANEPDRMGSSEIGNATPWKLWKPRRQAELLVHDDDIVRLNPAPTEPYNQDSWFNELRITRDGQEQYLRLTPDFKMLQDGDQIHDPLTLKPFQMASAEKKQIWLTVKVPSAAAPGDYTTEIAVTAGGRNLTRFPLTVRVLPFELQAPSLHYGMYYRGALDVPGANPAPKRSQKSAKQYRLELQDMKDHGFPYVGLQQTVHLKPAMLRKYLDIYKEIGLPLDRLMYLKDKFFREDFAGRPDAAEQSARELIAILREYEPQGDFYFYGHDEAKGDEITAQFPLWEAVHRAGGKIWTSTHISEVALNLKGRLDAAVYSPTEFPWPYAFQDANKDVADQYRKGGCKSWSYRGPQGGHENAELYRRNYGIALWKHGWDGAMFFCYQFEDMYNDFHYFNFRDHTIAFAVTDGVVSTLGWEGLREAVDDMRYLRTLQFLADKKGKRPETEAWLQTLNPYEGNLDEIRAQIQARILALR